MLDKYYITWDKLYIDSIRLVDKMVQDNFEPQFMLALWRGGTLPGCIIHEALKYIGMKVDHIAPRTSSYEGVNQTKDRIEIHSTSYVVRKVNAPNTMLIVDDVFDKGNTIDALIKDLKMKMRNNFPKNTKVATVYWKPENNQTQIVPDYYVEQVPKDRWIIFPHELEGLGSLDELRQQRGEETYQILSKLKESRK